MDTERLLMKIANTIIANNNTTQGAGLFYGKTGVSMFLYLYSRFFHNKEYEFYADRLIDQLHNEDKSQLSTSLENGYSGIGIGIIWMLQNGFISTTNNRFLHDFDDIFLDNCEYSLKQDLLYSHRDNSSWTYWLWRKPLCNSEEISKWEPKILELKRQFYENDKKFNIVNYDGISENLWRAFAKNAPLNMFSVKELNTEVEKLQDNFIYEIDTINGKLSAIGLSLLINKIKATH